MRFLRHLAAVLLVVGIIVAAALAWGHGSTAGKLGSGPGPGPGPGPGLSLSNAGDLIRKSAAEVAVIVVVALISSVYQRRRRAARHRS